MGHCKPAGGTEQTLTVPKNRLPMQQKNHLAHCRHTSGLLAMPSHQEQEQKNIWCVALFHIVQATNKRNKKIISNLLKRIVIRKCSIFITEKVADMICTFICIDIPYSRWRKQQMKFIKDNRQSFIKQQTKFYRQQTNWLGKDRTKSTATSEGSGKTKEAVLQCKRHCFGRQKSLFCKSEIGNRK